jgi:thiamine monophosphate synthase
VFASPGKGQPLGVTTFAAFVRTTTLPVYALGGVQPEHVAQLRAAGCRGVSAISAISGAAKPAAVVQEFLRAWDAAHAETGANAK